MEQLPWNWQLTRDLCEPTQFSRILIIDGKYIAVKGYDKKIPWIYAVDYLIHDIVHSDVFASEDETSFSLFFQKLESLGYTPRIVVADDRAGLKNALLKVFPYARLQLCHNHYLENIRRELQIRSDKQKKYEHFFNSLRLHVFAEGTDEQKITQGLVHVFKYRTNGKRKLQNIVTTIAARGEDLFSYLTVPGCPNNTNLIELFNSHANARLKSIKGFQSLASAKRWTNALVIRRRTKRFTDCEGAFKHLNKPMSLEFTIKKTAQWPTILTKLGIPPITKFEKTD